MFRRISLSLVIVTLTFAAAELRAVGRQKSVPKPVSSAERAALDLVLAHLDGNLDAWWQALTSSAALRGLGREAALAEIAVRIGPADEATWTLATPGGLMPENHVVFVVEMASGLVDHILLGMAETGDGTWRVASVRCLVDPWPQPPAPAWRGSVGDRRPDAPLVASLRTLAVLAVLAVLSSQARWTEPAARRWGLRRAGAAAALAAASILACAGDDATAERATVAAEVIPPALLSDLAPLRDAMVRGERMPDLEIRTELQTQTELWRLQALLQHSDLGAAKAAYETLSDASLRLPLSGYLGLKIAHLVGDSELMRNAYLDVIDQGLDHDNLRAVAAARMIVLGETAQAKSVLESASQAGARDADVYYLLATLAALSNDLDALETDLETAWKLMPKRREEILGDPILAAIATLPAVFPIFSLSEVAEPVVPARPAATRPLEITADVRATLVGDLLTLSCGEASLSIPGGGALAPAAAAVLDAATAQERLQQEALNDIETIVAHANESPATLMGSRTKNLAAALLLEERWQDLGALTAAISIATIELAPPMLVKIRAHALEKMDRGDEGRSLLVALALNDRATKRRDPGTLYQLAESFVGLGEYDLALKLIARASDLSWRGGRPKRAEQIRMEQSLMADHRRLREGAFEIVYPPSTGERYPTAIAAVLEAERQRLGRWIPLVSGDPPIEVQLYPLRTFLKAYSQDGGLLVLGLYDGRLRIPFADVASLNDRVVAIVSHELAHALIARATSDRAPHWLQEGVAEHIQIRQDRSNPFPEIQDVGRSLAVPIVDAALRGWSAAEFTDLAYSQAAWLIHFVEARHGADGVKRLVGAFNHSAETDVAIERTFGVSVAAFQRQAVEWASTEAPQVWPSKAISYDGAFLNQVLAKADGLPAGRQPVMEVRHQRRGGDSRLRPSAQQRPLPQVSRRLQAAPRTDRRAADDGLQSWHKRYAASTATAKQQLAELVRARRTGLPIAGSLCRDLESSLRAVRGGSALAAPDTDVRIRLEGAYSELYSAARACLNGQDAQVDPAIRKAEQLLNQAASLLAPYKLAP